MSLGPTDASDATFTRVTVPVERDGPGGDHDVSADLLELYEILECEAAAADERHPAHFDAEAAEVAAVFRAGTAPIVTRAQWGARSPRSGYSSLSPQRGGVALHYNGPGLGSFPHSSCASKVRGIQAFHMDSRGWNDIAYSAVVCPHGYIFVGRWVNNRTAANGTTEGNDLFYALGGLWGVGDPLTDEAKGAYLDGIAVMRTQGRAGNRVVGHQQLTSTACPGEPVMAWIRAGLPAPPGYFEAGPGPGPAPAPALDRVRDAVGFIDHPHSDGGWMISAGGGVFTKPPAPFHGSLGGVRLNAPITGGASTPTGDGYWLFGADGGVFAFGDAVFVGTYGPLADEYARGLRRIIGGYFRGNPADRATWRYGLVSDRLESYDI